MPTALPPEADHRVFELLSRVMEAERKGWWVDKLDVVDRTDQHLAVIGPRADASDGELKSLGRALKQWKDTHGYARHIWGLDDLLVGRCPRTPPVYLMVPFPIRRPRPAVRAGRVRLHRRRDEPRRSVRVADPGYGRASGPPSVPR